LKRNTIFKLSLVVGLTALVAGCAPAAGTGTGTDTGDGAAPREDSVVIGTGPEGGVYAVVGGGLSEVINKHLDGVRASTQSTAASLENTRLVRDGEVDIALSDSLVYSQGLNNEGAFEDDPPMAGVTFLGGWYPAIGHHLVRVDSDIQSLGDMKGRSVCIAPGIQSTMLDQILSGWGMSIDDLKVVVDEYANCADRVANGEIDMFNYNGGGNSSIVIQAASLEQMRALSMPAGTAEKIVANGYNVWFEIEIPSDMYSELQGLPARTVANATGMLIANEELSEDTAYAIVKAMHEHHDELAKLHPQFAAYAFPEAAQNPFDEADMPTHPGALRYFTEQGWR